MRWGTTLGIGVLICAVSLAKTRQVKEEELAWYRQQLSADPSHPWRPTNPYAPPTKMHARPDLRSQSDLHHSTEQLLTPPSAQSSLWSLSPRSLLSSLAALVGWGIGISLGILIFIPKIIMHSVSRLYLVLWKSIRYMAHHPVHIMRNILDSISMLVYGLSAPLRYVMFALYTVLVRWPSAALSSVMHLAFQVYVICGVAIITGALLGLLGGIFLALENRLYVARRSSTS